MVADCGNGKLGTLNNEQLSCFLTNFQFKLRLTSIMVIDFIGCWLIEVVCKYLFADLEPKTMITRGRERREERRRREDQLRQDTVNNLTKVSAVKKGQ